MSKGLGRFCRYIILKVINGPIAVLGGISIPIFWQYCDKFENPSAGCISYKWIASQLQQRLLNVSDPIWAQLNGVFLREN